MWHRVTAIVGLALLGLALLAVRAEPRALRVACERPRLLRLVRFEDGSARLLCGERVLVRVAVPY
jgi:hypothetical protein